MSDILTIAASGMNAYKRGLDVTANNIANISTPGYSRQSVMLSGAKPNMIAGSFIGSGVSFDGVRRFSDQYAVLQVQKTMTMKSQYDAFYQQAAQVDKLLSGEGTSVSAGLQEFYNTISQLNETPDSMSSRNVMLKQSELLVNQFNNLQQQLDAQQAGNTQQIQIVVGQINSLSSRLADVNEQLQISPNSPELLDTRDELLKELSQYTSVSTTEVDTGAVNVFIGRGESLVVGGNSQTISAQSAGDNGIGTTITLSNGTELTDSLTTGELGGLIDYEKNVLGESSMMLGQMAVGMAMAFNEQHQLGVNLNDQLGGNFFNDFNSTALQQSRAIADTGNTGTGGLSVEISDISQTQVSDYQLVVTDTGTNEVRLVRESDGQSFTLNWTNSPPAPPAGQVEVDGMTITVDDISNLDTSDSYQLSPFRGAAGDLSLEISDPRQIALAAAVRTESPLSNSGSGKIDLGTVLDTSEVQKDYRIEFTSPTQYNIVNVTDSVTTGPFAFTPNENNEVFIPDSGSPSYSVMISGAPDTSDQFNLSFNTGSAGDNRNGLALNDIQNSKVFNGGSESVFDRYAGLIADVGGSTYSAQVRSQSADILHKQAVDYRESISGVNMDEEAANILRFEQAYQAAGQLLQVSADMLNVLYSVMR